MIRVVIVDDEPLAREGLRLRLQREPDLEILGEAADGSEAIDLVTRERPDLLFLDVQMPRVDGFAALEAMADSHLPLVVFVTAHDDYLLPAFDVQALHYLLKPIDDARLAEALRRARAEMARGELAKSPSRIARMLDERGAAAAPGPAAPPLRRFAVHERGRFHLVPVAAVRWIVSAGNYIELHTGDGTHLVRMTLSTAERRLGAENFVRIHRTILVRADAVRTVRRTGNGDFQAVLADGQPLPLSRHYRDRLLETRSLGRNVQPPRAGP